MAVTCKLNISTLSCASAPVHGGEFSWYSGSKLPSVFSNLFCKIPLYKQPLHYPLDRAVVIFCKWVIIFGKFISICKKYILHYPRTPKTTMTSPVIGILSCTNAIFQY